LIYKNIDSIGHIAILSILLIVIAVCFYYCFKNSKGFQKTETTFENPVLEYLVLAANILTCIFIGYLQFQYKPFGTHYGLATLIPTDS
jgi:heme/copper-type cytochrome/quinol oxidase subunit 2